MTCWSSSLTQILWNFRSGIWSYFFLSNKQFWVVLDWKFSHEYSVNDEVPYSWSTLYLLYINDLFVETILMILLLIIMIIMMAMTNNTNDNGKSSLKSAVFLLCGSCFSCSFCCKKLRNGMIFLSCQQLHLIFHEYMFSISCYVKC